MPYLRAMPTHLIATDSVDATAAVSRIGGQPLLAGTAWPRCSGCGEPLGFLAQVDLAALGDPTLTDAWAVLFSCDRFGGCAAVSQGKGTLALVVSKAGASPATEPPSSGTAPKPLRVFPEGPIALAARASSVEVPLGGGDEETGHRVVGSVGAVTEWMQDPVEASCPSCGAEMRVAFQLDEAWGMTTATYTFVCSPCRQAVLVVQPY
ncbi:MAG: hypothetical protein JWM10_1834 [Myxococcaceae bacterium]|nr:hypothetical protein [Myxococcaceae bacterium]